MEGLEFSTSLESFNLSKENEESKALRMEVCDKTLTLQPLLFWKSLGVHKILVRQIWFYPPPEKGPKMRRKSSKLTLFPGGGGGNAIYGQNDFMDIWAFLIAFLEKKEKKQGKPTKQKGKPTKQKGRFSLRNPSNPWERKEMHQKSAR